MKKLLITMLAIIPLTSLADYDVERIKKDMTETKSFGVEKWELNEAGNAWMAKHGLKNTVISATDKLTGMMIFVENEPQAFMAMLNCTLLGYIGVELKDDARVNALAYDAVSSQKKQSLVINNVKYSVEPMQMGNVVAFSCTIEAAN